MARFIYFLSIFFVFHFQASAQLFYKLKITSDAYGIENLDKSKISQIYVNDRAAKNNLSLMPYVKKLRLRLHKLGYSVTMDESKAKFILNWMVEVNGPIITVNQSTTQAPSQTQTVTFKNNEGKEERAEVTIPGEFIQEYSELHTYDKTLSIELRLIESDRLIWQGEATIADKQKTHANYASYLVFDATYAFLNSTRNHPQESFYTRRQLRRVEEFFQLW